MLEAMGREPAKGGTHLAQSGLGQTQIIGDLIGESEEVKKWEFGSTSREFGSGENSKSRSLILRLTISRNIQFILVCRW